MKKKKNLRFDIWKVSGEFRGVNERDVAGVKSIDKM